MSSSKKISAFVVCCNEERNIHRCLSSIKWCDEIIIIDSGSTDSTLEICREFTHSIVQRPWPGFVEQKRFGLSQCTGEWVLNLDADEEVSPELKAEILGVVSGNSNSVDGFELLRVVNFLDRWWRKGGWYPEYRLRLVRKSAASWGGEDPHEKALVSGKVSRLSSELRHYTYDSFADQVRTLNNFSSVAAERMFKNGAKFRLSDIIFRPIGRFAKFYLIKGGFQEGLAGLIVAILESYYVFLKYIKLWELGRGKVSPP